VLAQSVEPLGTMANVIILSANGARRDTIPPVLMA
jgi:hypothetical protein